MIETCGKLLAMEMANRLPLYSLILGDVSLFI